MFLDKGTVFEETRYRKADQTGETYDDGKGFRCSVCANVWKADYLDPRWEHCPKCGYKITAWKY